MGKLNVDLAAGGCVLEISRKNKEVTEGRVENAAEGGVRGAGWEISSGAGANSGYYVLEWHAFGNIIHSSGLAHRRR